MPRIAGLRFSYCFLFSGHKLSITFPSELESEPEALKLLLSIQESGCHTFLWTILSLIYLYVDGSLENNSLSEKL